MSDKQMMNASRLFGWLLACMIVLVLAVAHANDVEGQVIDCLAKPVCELRGN